MLRIQLKRLFHIVGVAGLSMAVPAFAQSAMADTDVAATQTKRSAGALEEIVVTAQRREEKLQDVPVAVSAFTEADIENRGIDRLDDLNALAPGLQISKTPSNSTISQISIRGITQINPAIYWDPAVGVYVDGVYIGKAQGSIFDLVDLANVEVLRGPQGTLYGRNTLAGAINLISRAPTGEWAGKASLEVGDYNAMVQKASVDLPEMKGFRVSIGARSERRDGWVKTSRTSPLNDFNDRHNDGLRLAVDYVGLDDFTVAYRYDQSNVDQSNNYDQLYRIAPGFGLDDYASTDREEFADVNSPSYEESRVTGHSLTLTWDLDDRNTLKSISGYRRLEWNDSLDLDGSPLNVAFTQRFTDYDQFSQDLQWIGSLDRLNYVAGLYYFTDDGQTNNPQLFFDGAAEYDSRYGTGTDAWAAYGQADYKLLDALTLTLGLRYTSEKKKLDRAFGVRTSPDDPYYYLIPEGTHAAETFTDTTPMVSVAYRFNESVNVYAKYTEGFKSGGFNGEYSNPMATPEDNIAETLTPFKPEKQKSFELGAKTDLFGGRARVNVALFHNELEDLQASIFLGQGAAATAVRNAGEATVEGVEVEAVLLLTAGTTLSLNYAYLDSQYDEFIDLAIPDRINQADNRAFVHAPENAYNLTLNSLLAETAWGRLRMVVDYSYTDSFYTYPYQLADSGPDYNPNAQLAANSEVDGHGMLNLRLSLADIALGEASGELAIWCRNALDDDTATNFIDFGPAFGGLTVANFEEPRTLGITGIVRW